MNQNEQLSESNQISYPPEFFDWIPFYQEFSVKLLEYKNRRSELLQILTSVFTELPENLGLSNPFIEKDGIAHDTCPFTVYSSFNRALKEENKIQILTAIKKHFDIKASVPTHFSGIPQTNNQQMWFYRSLSERDPADIPNLWALFEKAVRYADNPGENTRNEFVGAYNTVIPQPFVKWNITMGLFWIRPETFLNLDAQNRNYLNNNGITKTRIKDLPNGDDYLSITAEVKNYLSLPETQVHTFYAFSHYVFTRPAIKTPIDVPELKEKIWIYAPGEKASMWNEFYQGNLFGIGWKVLGPLTQYHSKNEIQKALEEKYSNESDQGQNAKTLWDFYGEMKPGDIVIARSGLTRIIGYGVVSSDYMYDETVLKYAHVRKISWKSRNEKDLTKFQFSMKTLVPLTAAKDYYPECIEYLEENRALDTQSQDNADDITLCWYVGSYVGNEDLADDMINNGYWKGNPTARVGNYADSQLNHVKSIKVGDRIALKSTYTQKNNLPFKTDALPVSVMQIKATGVVTANPGDGTNLKVDWNRLDEPKIWYLFTSMINVWKVFINPQSPNAWRRKALLDFTFKDIPQDYDKFLENRWNNGIDDEDGEPYSRGDFLREVYLTPLEYQKLIGLLERKKNVILCGPPGVGKTFAAKRLAYSILTEKNREQVRFIQFHQNYSYEDFIQGYRPDPEGFKLKNGPFYMCCKEAEVNPDKKYFFIIDEINRGNMGKIFGELLMLIEADKRGEMIKLMYSEEPFTVPENVYIIGMMNTADRSLAMIDYALRRRFAFFELKPGFDTPGFTKRIEGLSKSVDKELAEKYRNLVDTVKRINLMIAEDTSLGSGCLIGHSYLCTDRLTFDWLESVIEYELIPLLEEYWFDNDEKLKACAALLRAVISK